MTSIDGHNAACCTIPPIISKGYEPKGKYETIGGLKTYVTGPASAKTAILVFYDIFGYFSQTIQGADILATSDKEHSYQVFMPDFFEGNPADIAWYPPVTEEQKTALYGWFPTRAPPTGVAKLPKILADIESVYGKKTWASLGFCWGGKVVALTSGPNSPWTVSAQCHPAMVDAADAAKVTVPFLTLASGEEKKDEIEAFDAALDAEHLTETFGDQLHGWMSARADLEDERVRKEYERAYGVVLEWFGKHMGEKSEEAVSSNL